MQLHLEKFPGYSLVRPQIARLDAAGAPALRSTTADLANEGRFRVILDLKEVQFVDSSGLGVLIHMHKTLQPQGRLVLCHVDAKVGQLFKITRLDRVFTLASNEDEALKLVMA
jgi:anti-sigma B factor antagonist